VQIFENLRLLRPFDVVLFGMLQVVLDHFAKGSERFAGHELGCERIVDRRQHLFFNLAQRNRVIGLFASQFFYQEIIWEIDDHQPWLAGF
jgi:hypothetical protein